jgi:hypothetical protein
MSSSCYGTTVVQGRRHLFGFCRKVRFLGLNPKIGCQKFNGLETPKLSKK